MPARDLDLLTTAALAAGEIAMRFWRHDPKVWEKDDGAGPVTEADLAVNRMLEDTLRAARPDYGWLSEESEDDAVRLGRERVFIIDPIDGTRAFIAGEQTFSHSLAIAENGRVIAGVVFLPARDRIYTASIGGPALRNRDVMVASTRGAAEGAKILTTRPNLLPELWPGGVPDLTRSFRPSLAYRLCLAGEGRHDGMLTLRDAWEWDIAAGALIAEQAGAVVTDRVGAPLHFNRAVPLAAGVIAAPAKLHAEFLARLAG